LPDETIKINVYTSDSYRRLIKKFQVDVIQHTYQPRGERAYRVVLRHLHHSFHPDVIKGELEGLGHIQQCAQYSPPTDQGPTASLLCGSRTARQQKHLRSSVLMQHEDCRRNAAEENFYRAVHSVPILRAY
jgi:hypothetical protein